MAKRNKTKYPGVYWIDGLSSDGKPEKIFYIKYSRSGKVTEEPVGRQFRDDMTPAKASLIRTKRIEGDELANKEKRNAATQSNITIDQVYSEYLSYSHFKPTTLDREKVRYNHSLKPKFGQKAPEEITQADFNNIIKDLKDSGLAPQTIKHVAGLLFRIIKFAAAQGYCTLPSIKMNLPRINNQKTEDLTREQLQTFIKAMDEDPHPYAGKLMKLALFTGMRAGELFKLQWSDIDLEKGFIWIRDPKGGSDKKIPLNEAARNHLTRITKMDNSPYVFPSEDGSQRTTIKKQALRIKTKAGIPQDFRPIHGLRHVFASALASSGQIDMYTLQNLLNHSSSQMTQRYAHLRDDALQRASTIAGSIFGELDSSSKE